MLGVWGSQSSPSTLGLPTLSEGGHLSQKPAFFSESMERILWLYNWKLFLLRDGGWHVTQPSQRWAWHSMSLVQSKPRPQLVPSRVPLVLPHTIWGSSEGF